MAFADHTEDDGCAQMWRNAALLWTRRVFVTQEAVR